MPQQEASSLLSRNAVFRNFLSASTVSLLGTSIFDIAMPLYVLDRTHSVVALSMATLALNLPFFLMAPITGYSVDNFNKRRIMLAADIGQVLCMVFLLFYDLFGPAELWPILVTVFIAKSCMITFETVTTFQLIPALVTKEDLSEANTWFLSSQRLIQIVGPLSGGILLSVLGIRSAIGINALSFGATLYFVFSMKNLNQLIEAELGSVHRAPIGLTSLIAHLKDSLRYIWDSKLFKPFIVLMFLWNLSPLIPNTSSLTYFFTEVKHFNSARYGLVVSLFGVAGILGYIVSGPVYRRFDFHRAFVGSALWQAAVATCSLAFMGHPVGLAATFSLSRIGSSVLTMGTFLLRQSAVPRNRIGGVNACIRMFFMSAAPLSALMQAFVIDHFGVYTSLVVGSLCLWGVWYTARKVATQYDEMRRQLADTQAA